MTRTFTPRHSRVLVDFILSKRVRQSLVRTSYPGGIRGSAGLCRPRFSFFIIQFSKNRHRFTRCRGPFRFWLRGRPSVAYAALLNCAEGRLRSILLRRQRRTALVGEAYIVATNNNCQHRSAMFFRFLVEMSTRPKLVSWLGRIVSGVPLIGHAYDAHHCPGAERVPSRREIACRAWQMSIAAPT